MNLSRLSAVEQRNPNDILLPNRRGFFWQEMRRARLSGSIQPHHAFRALDTEDYARKPLITVLS